MRWRTARPAVEPAPLGAPHLVEAAHTAAEHRAAAAEAAVWLLRNTEVPTDEVLDAYLARLDEPAREAARALAEVVTR
jgi:hypothetical protein